MLNLDNLHTIAGDDSSLVDELLEQFIESATRELAQLCAAVDSGSMSEVIETAHRLRGSCLVIGADTLSETLQAIEYSAREDNDKRLTAQTKEARRLLDQTIRLIQS